MDADVVEAVNNLTSRWAQELPPGNQVVSGLGLWPLLAILATAADEPGRAELAAAAGVQASAGSTKAVELMKTVDAAADLHAALGVWVHERLKLSESFDSVIPAALSGTLTGDLAGDKAKLDAWAAEHTDNLIRQMPTRGDAGSGRSTGVCIVLADYLGAAVQGRDRWRVRRAVGGWVVALARAERPGSRHGSGV